MDGTRDPTRLGRLVMTLTGLWLLADVISGAASLNTVAVLGGLGGGIAPQDVLEQADLLSGLAGVAFLLTFVAAGIAILRWTYMVSRNAHGLSEAMTVSPGWSVGWYFVPIANLFKPFAALRETWQVTFDPAHPADVPVPAVMRWWWGAWLISNVLGNISFRLEMAEPDLGKTIAANWLGVFALPVDLVLTLALVTIVKRLSVQQYELSDAH